MHLWWERDDLPLMKELSIRGAAQMLPLHLRPLRAAINTSHPEYSSWVTSYREVLRAPLEERCTLFLEANSKVVVRQGFGSLPAFPLTGGGVISERIRPDPRYRPLLGGGERSEVKVARFNPEDGEDARAARKERESGGEPGNGAFLKYGRKYGCYRPPACG